MNRIGSLFAVLVLVLAVPALIAGCGGDEEGDEDPQEVLDAAFSGENDVSSGNLDLTANVSAEGEQGGNFEFTLEGPFQGDPDDPNAVPELDLTASASGEGGGDELDFEGGLVVTPDNAFVEYQGTTYEVGTENFEQAKQQLEAQTPQETDEEGVSPSEALKQACEQAGAPASACDIDLQSWLTNLQNEGSEDVEGVETTHISSDLDVEKMLTDIGGIVAAVPGSENAGIDPNQLNQFSEAVTEASFDVYSGVEDDIVRKLNASLAIDPSQLAVGGAVPVDSIDIDFSLTLSEVNEEQTIEAPEDAQPIEDLLSETGLGDLGLGLGGDLGGGLGGGLGDLGGAEGGGAGGGGGGAGGGGGGGGAGAGGQVDPEAAEKYLECIADAGGDPEKINACARQL